MAGLGPPPKEGGKLGRYQSQLDKPEHELAADSCEAPRLPGYREYSYRVKRWWDTWVASPQAQTFVATDWQRLLMLAPMVGAYYALMEGDVRAVRSALLILAEIRQNESLLGATHLDRLRGRIKIDRDTPAGADDDETATPAGVAVLDKYRKQLGA